MLLTKCILLSHLIFHTSIKVNPTNIEVITKLLIPKTQKDIRSFLGHASYYRRFIENFTSIVAPMFKLFMKYVDFHWDSSFQTSFENLKEKLLIPPVLRGPNWALPFHIFTDASNIALRAVLGHKEGQT